MNARSLTRTTGEVRHPHGGRAAKLCAKPAAHAVDAIWLVKIDRRGHVRPDDYVGFSGFPRSGLRFRAALEQARAHLDHLTRLRLSTPGSIDAEFPSSGGNHQAVPREQA
jgi:hypothetical protein